MTFACVLWNAEGSLLPFAETCFLFTSRVYVTTGAVLLDLSDSRVREGIITEQILKAARVFNVEPRLGFSSRPSTALALARQTPLPQQRNSCQSDFRLNTHRKQNLPTCFTECCLEGSSTSLAADTLSSTPLQEDLTSQCIKAPRKASFGSSADAQNQYFSIARKQGSPEHGQKSDRSLRFLPFKSTKLLQPRGELSVQNALGSPRGSPYGWRCLVPGGEIWEDFLDGDYTSALGRALARVKGRGRAVTKIKLKIDGQEFTLDAYKVSEENLLRQIRTLCILSKGSGTLGITESLPGWSAKLAENHYWHEVLRSMEAWAKALGFDPQNQKQLSFLFARSSSLKLLKRPKKISIVPEGLRRDGEDYKVVSLEGPVRIGSDWWCGEPIREYYRAHLRCGEKWWIYEGKQGVYLHALIE